MISKNHTTECYVYITLPGETNPVTAGRFALDINQRGEAVGNFIYGKSYLARTDAVAIDPVELKLDQKLYKTVKLNGVFGAIRDAGPDFWGRRLIERHTGITQLGEVDYLLNSPDDRAGALGFGRNQTPPAPLYAFNKTLDLGKLQKSVDDLIQNEEASSNSTQYQIENLMLLGTSMGGARPKAVVEDNEGLWLAKFNRVDDKWNNARVEHAMLILAQKCGLYVADSKLVTIGNMDVLLVKRFDREKVQYGYLRSRMISALTLLGAEDTYQSRDKWSYVLLSEELRKISVHAAADAAELFRRMCFNALISNIDDHPRNHAFIAKDKDWRISPAYDLTPFVPVSQERRDLAMICGDFGRIANIKNLLTQPGRFLLQTEQAAEIIHQMTSEVHKNWYSISRSAGVTERDCEQISGAFVYSGFNV